MKVPRVVFSILIMGVAIAVTGAVIVQNANASKSVDVKGTVQSVTGISNSNTLNGSVAGAVTVKNDPAGNNENEDSPRGSNPPQQATPAPRAGISGTNGLQARGENERDGSGHGSRTSTPATPQQPTPTPAGFTTVSGTVTGVSIVVNGQTIIINQDTRIEGVLKPGSQAQVEAVQQADGSLLALKISVPNNRVNEGDNENENENENEDGHQGTPSPTVTPAPTATPVPGATPTPTALPVSYSATIQPILNASCTGCHGNRGGVTLSSYASTINTVTPGNASNSLLYRSVTGNGATRMPPGGSLSASQIQSIANWINQGALNN